VADIEDAVGVLEAAAELEDELAACVFGVELEPLLPQAARPAPSAQASRIWGTAR
jgi:hypothetical protein